MEFQLESLTEAFKNAAYRKRRSSYKLFAFLLATPADQRLIPGLLVHFSEMHFATGSDVLLIAPSIHMRIGHDAPWGSAPASPEEAIEVFETGIFPAYMGGSAIERVNVRDDVSRFLRSLTEQSYALAAFLGLEKSSIPCMLFFETLSLPPKFMRWDLSRIDAPASVIRLRSILDELNRRCDWGREIPRTISRIEYELSRSDERVLAYGQKTAARLQSEIDDREKTAEYLRSLRRLRDACTAGLNARHPDLPLQRLRGNVKHLCSEPDNEQYIKYVRRQRRNWKRRMPPEFLVPIDRFLALASTRPLRALPRDGVTIEEQIASAEKTARDARLHLEQHFKAMEDAPARERRKLLDHVEALRVQAKAIEKPLDVLRSMGLEEGVVMRQAPRKPAPPSISQLFEYWSCFISYSSRDTEFAQRLHADLERAGVRCWFAPEDLGAGEKFRQRIDDSIWTHDKVLLVLSAEAIRSDWVEAEVESTFERERRENRVVLLPIKLDDEIMITPLAWASHVRRTRHIGDFREASSHSGYEAALERLLRDLRTD